MTKDVHTIHATPVIPKAPNLEQPSCIILLWTIEILHDVEEPRNYGNIYIYMSCRIDIMNRMSMLKLRGVYSTANVQTHEQSKLTDRTNGVCRIGSAGDKSPYVVGIWI